MSEKHLTPFEERTGLRYVNIALHGVRSYMGKKLSDTTAVVLFDRPKMGDTHMVYWDLEEARVITAEPLDLRLDYVFIDEEDAVFLEGAMSRFVARVTGPIAAPVPAAPSM